MLVPHALKHALAEAYANIKTQQIRTAEKRKELGQQEEYLRSLLVDKELISRAISILEKAP